MNTLNREAAPLGADVWRLIDAEAATSAAEQLTGRRFLPIDGPYGVGLTSLEVGHDDFCRSPAEDEAAAIGSRAVGVPMLRKTFRLSIRRLAAHVDLGQPLILRPVGDAAEAVARREEELIYHGQPGFALEGLLNATGSSSVAGGNWQDLDQALKAVLEAVGKLDAHNYRGPYALALSPTLYNGLYRRYDNTDMLQVEHLGRLCERGVFKAPIEGAVLVDGRVGRLVVGQDLMAGFVQQDGVHCEMFVSESIALVIDEPEAICVITRP